MSRSITAIVGFVFAGVLSALVIGAASPAMSTTNPPPVVTVPGATLTTKATSPRGALISFIVAATDDVAPTRIDCAPPSGSLFAAGTTTVRCTAADDTGATTTKTFDVHVKGAAEQIRDLMAVVQGLVPVSGVYNGLLDKLVTALNTASVASSDACAATNAFVNELRAQTGKKIDDARAAQLLGAIADIRAALGCIESAAPPVLFVPSGDITTMTSPHLATAAVLYAATNATGGPAVTCDRPGPLYPIGRTLVTCRAEMGGRMSAPASFGIVVVDNELPQLTLPPDMTAHAAVGRNSAEVTYAATATDNSGAVAVSCLPTSGSTFPLGKTTVSCTATDASGNTASGTFSVTVDLVITGRVTDVTGAPIPGTYVRVFLASALFQAPQFRVALVQTDDNGIYIAAVPAGSYKVLHGGFGTPYFEKWWHDRTSLGDADVITMGTSVGGIDAQLERGLFIRGHVTDAATGLPIQGVGVNLSDASRFCCFFAGGSGTDANGDYAILVRAGSYKVLFYSNDNTVGAYAPEWWDDQTSFAAAATITITTADRSNVDAALAHGFVISGRVTAKDTGAAIQNAFVNAQDSTLPCCSLVSFASTNQNGDYRLIVRTGTFKLTISPPAGSSYLRQWWDGQSSFDTANPLTITGDRPNVNAMLVPGVLVHGTVTDELTSVGIVGVGVQVTDASDGCCPFITGTQTGAGGVYTVVAPSGQPVKIFFGIPPGGPLQYIQEWYDNKPGFDVATTKTFTAETFGIDAALTPAVMVHGTVTDELTHVGIGGIGVNATDASAGCCLFISGTQTTGSGSYTLLAPKGIPVKIQFVVFGPGVPPYIGEWYDNQPGFDVATTKTFNTETFGIDAALTPGIRIHGTVTDELTHAGIGGIDIGVSDANAPCCRGFNTGSRTNADGTYSMLVPKSIPVKIQFFTFSNPSLPYIGEWYDNKPSFETATVRTFSTETFGIDAALTPAVVVHGTVTDELTHSGIGGVGVNVNDATATCCRGLGFATTNPDGTFAVLAPAGKPVKIFFGIPPGGPLQYIQEWYDNQPGFETATVRTFSTETFGIDAALSPAVVVHGTVTDELTHVGIGGVGVNVNDAAATCCRGIGFAMTNPDGTYSMLVPKGKPVKIFFGIPPGSPLQYIQEWYDNQPGFDVATTKTFIAETFNIDAALTPAVAVHGTVTDEITHTGVNGVFVNANDATAGCCLFVSGTQTGVGGGYRLLVPAGKPVKIFFNVFGPGAPPYASEWYDNQPDFDHAQSLTFASETFGIDAALAQAVHVHGIVTDETTGTGIGRISIQAVDSAVPCCPFRNLANAQTDSNGNYDLLVPKGRTVKIQFFVWRPDDPAYISEWFDNQPDFDHATAVAFTTDSALNVALAPAAVVFGIVTDRDTHAAIGHISVQAVDPAAPCCRGLAFAETDGNGAYRMRVPKGLPVKIHFFVYRPDDPPYIGSWDANQISFELAAVHTFFADTEVDAALTRAFALGGTVTDRVTGLPIAMIQIGVSDFTLSCCVTVTSTNTDATGRWMVPIPAGTYRVWFGDDTLHRYAPEFWDREPDPAHANPVVVSEDTPGIDAQLLPLP